MLVLTFNRTLRGYVQELARHQTRQIGGIDLDVSTFSSWAANLVGGATILNSNRSANLVVQFGVKLPFASDFLVNEVAYALGRFQPEDLARYLDVRREGRGAAPRVERAMRERILNEVIAPYAEFKEKAGVMDWNDLAVAASRVAVDNPYEVVIVDEGQDFSANQTRAVLHHLAPDNSLTLVLDAAQRIYPNGFTWREVGLTFPTGQIFTLKKNHRNTAQIARFARPLLEGLDLTSDGTMPDSGEVTEQGPVPSILKGRFSRQVDFALRWIADHADLDHDRVGFLHAKGGGYFQYLRERLRGAGLEFVEIARNSEWPLGDESIALSTIHSAKGLEFEHVFILGLDSDITTHGSEDGDGELENLRRLLAMGIARARRSVTVGFRPEATPVLARYLDPATYQEYTL